VVGLQRLSGIGGLHVVIGIDNVATRSAAGTRSGWRYCPRRGRSRRATKGYLRCYTYAAVRRCDGVRGCIYWLGCVGVGRHCGILSTRRGVGSMGLAVLYPTRRCSVGVVGL